MPVESSRREVARRLFGSPVRQSSPPPPRPTSLIEQVVRRATFGADATTVAEVEAMGLDAWLNQQLDPRNIDDSAADAIVDAAIEPWRSNAADVRMLARALFSKRQLAWRMAHFLNNHFSTYRGATVGVSETKEDEAFFHDCFGSFASLLRRSAKSPAMIDYLDSQSNVAASPNENYARELLELHTLGIGAGYTEPDVAEIARVFTGWSRVRVTQPSGPPIDSYFLFRSGRHDSGAKTTSFGWSTPGFSGADGVLEGYGLLDHLAAMPQTATRFTTKLCRYFVSDAPPAGLLQRVEQAFVSSQGSLQATVRAIFYDPEFAAASNTRSKVRDGFEFIVNVLRRARPDNVRLLTVNNRVGQLGSQPHLNPVPTGYPEVGPAWQGAGNLLPRWDFADDFAHNRLSQTHVPWTSWFPTWPTDGATFVQSMLDRFVDGDVPPTTVLALTVFMDNRLASLPANPSFNQIRNQARDLLSLVLQLPELQLH